MPPDSSQISISADAAGEDGAAGAPDSADAKWADADGAECGGNQNRNRAG